MICYLPRCSRPRCSIAIAKHGITMNCFAKTAEVFPNATSPPAGDSSYLHVKVWVDVRLLHQLFDLSTALHQLTDLLGKNSHLKLRVWKLRNLISILILSESRKEALIMSS